MTLLKIFNQQLEGLKTISEQIEKAILYKGWPEQKTKQAIEIVRQIKKMDLIVTGYTNYNFILLKQLSITLSPDECGISGATIFHEENIHQAHHYIYELLKDINEISAPDIYFSVGGHTYEDGTTCTYHIAWEF